MPGFAAEDILYHNTKFSISVEGNSHLLAEVLAGGVPASSSLCSWGFPSALPTFHTAAKDVQSQVCLFRFGPLFFFYYFWQNTKTGC